MPPPQQSLLRHRASHRRCCSSSTCFLLSRHFITIVRKIGHRCCSISKCFLFSRHALHVTLKSVVTVVAFQHASPLLESSLRHIVAPYRASHRRATSCIIMRHHTVVAFQRCFLLSRHCHIVASSCTVVAFSSWLSSVILHHRCITSLRHTVVAFQMHHPRSSLHHIAPLAVVTFQCYIIVSLHHIVCNITSCTTLL
jgi:hypothetical protein